MPRRGANVRTGVGQEKQEAGGNRGEYLSTPFYKITTPFWYNLLLVRGRHILTFIAPSVKIKIKIDSILNQNRLFLTIYCNKY